jgi:hypothetical protein
LEKAKKGASDEVENDIEAEEAMEKADADASARIASLEKDLAEMKALLKGQSGGQSLSADVVREIARLGKNEVGADGLVDPTFIAPEDEMEKAEVFYRHGPTHNIFHGTKAGVHIPLPYKMKVIKFVKSSGWTTRSGQGLQQRIISIFVTKNRKVSEFLKNYSEFGKTIHLDRERAFNNTVSAKYMDLYNRHHQSLQGQPIGVLAEMAKEWGVDTSMGMSHEDYAREIAEKQAWKAMAEEKAQFESQMRGMNVERMVNG